jgi:hypothetical protein
MIRAMPAAQAIPGSLRSSPEKSAAGSNPTSYPHRLRLLVDTNARAEILLEEALYDDRNVIAE